MKQLFFQAGRPVVLDVVPPGPERGRVLVSVRCSAVSAGTELGMLESSARSFLSLAIEKRRRVDRLVRAIQARDMDDLFRRFQRLSERRAQIFPAGYSAAGVVLASGDGATRFAPGARVAVMGAGYASHAAVVSVPENLAVAIPGGLEFEAASTAALGAIALQAVRRAGTVVGEVVLVLGLGVLGQIAARILRAAGARVLAWDPEPARCAAAARQGVEILAAEAPAQIPQRTLALTGLNGADQAILAATSGGVEAAASLRRGGTLVFLGNAPVSIPREIAYERELTLKMSTSYGPGRYDPAYEEGGADYPHAWVRWTEGRNVAAWLDLLAERRVTVDDLFAIADGMEGAAEVYAALRSRAAAPGAIFRLAEESARVVAPVAATKAAHPLRVAILGAGAFTGGVILPALKKLRADLRVELLAGTVPARRDPLAALHGIPRTASSYEEAARDGDIDLVVVATRHDRHAALTRIALEAGHAVFCEKPLALSEPDVDAIERLLPGRLLVIGWNRRFAPAVVRWREELANRRGPLHLAYRVQAGPLPASHWLHGPEGGGRLVGEAVHMIDLLRHLVGAPLASAAISGGAPPSGFSLALSYDDGSSATLLYAPTGAPEHPKERLEGHWDGRSVEMDDWKALREAGRSRPLWEHPTQQKGYEELWRAAVNALLAGASAPIPAGEILETSRAVLALDRARRSP